jgi:hypothetical protein
MLFLRGQLCEAQVERGGPDSTVVRDSTSAQDTVTQFDRSGPDSTVVRDSTATKIKPAEEMEQEPEAAPRTEQSIVDDAITWVRRLLFRGAFDATQIGAYASYQLTAWSEATGSSGPIQARVSVMYLGSMTWLGKRAEWLQASYQTVEDEPALIEFDFLVPPGVRIQEIYRALYRMNRGPLKAAVLDMPANQLDYDRTDHAEAIGEETVKLYSGTFTCEKMRGAGSDGADVVFYRAPNVPPLSIVRLGYGELGLTYTGGGIDATPRFDSPPQPR